MWKWKVLKITLRLVNFCDLLDIASIFITHIFREFLSSIYVENEKLKVQFI